MIFLLVSLLFLAVILLYKTVLETCLECVFPWWLKWKEPLCMWGYRMSWMEGNGLRNSVVYLTMHKPSAFDGLLPTELKKKMQMICGCPDPHVSVIPVCLQHCESWSPKRGGINASRPICHQNVCKLFNHCKNLLSRKMLVF